MYAPVVALTILDANTLEDCGRPSLDSRALVVVRNPETNITHPNVLCVPTQRIPKKVAQQLLGASNHIHVNDGPSLCYYPEEWHDNSRNSESPEVIFLVNSLLCRKLGLADALEFEYCAYKASLYLSIKDEVFHPDHSEMTIMFNIIVKIRSGINLIPMRTSSYNSIGWCSLGKFLEIIETRNPTIFDVSLSPVQICVQGLCIKSSSIAIEHQLQANSMGA